MGRDLRNHMGDAIAPHLRQNPLKIQGFRCRHGIGKGFLPQQPDSLEQLDLLLLTVVKPRKVRRDGIHFQNFAYIEPTLAAYVGESVSIRYDPRDLAEIRVYYNNAFLCRAICQELADKTISLKEIIKAIKINKVWK